MVHDDDDDNAYYDDAYDVPRGEDLFICFESFSLHPLPLYCRHRNILKCLATNMWVQGPWKRNRIPAVSSGKEDC